MKKLILILLLFTTIISVSAVMTEKPLGINITNCYNVSIKVEQLQGKETLLTFNNCPYVGDWTWNCNCFNTEGKNFSLVMQTDDLELREPRVYNMKIKATYFNFKRQTINQNVDDYGDYFDLSDTDYETIGTSFEKYIYVNNTVYVNRTVEKIVYQNITSNMTCPENNIEATCPETTIIDNTKPCPVENTVGLEKSLSRWKITAIVAVIIVALLVFWIMVRK